MMIVIRGRREGVGTTTIAVALAWFWAKHRPPVLAIDAAWSPLTLGAHYLVPETDTGWNDPNVPVDVAHLPLWRHGEGLYVLPKTLKHRVWLHDEARVKALVELTAKTRFQDIVVDIGSSTTSPWLNYADQIVTVLPPDVNGFARLKSDTCPTSDLFVMNGLHPGLTSDNDLATLLLTHPTLVGRLYEKPIPFDEYVRRALLLGTPVTERYPFATSVAALAGFAAWLRLKTAKGT